MTLGSTSWMRRSRDTGMACAPALDRSSCPHLAHRCKEGRARMQHKDIRLPSNAGWGVAALQAQLHACACTCVRACMRACHARWCPSFPLPKQQGTSTECLNELVHCASMNAASPTRTWWCGRRPPGDPCMPAHSLPTAAPHRTPGLSQLSGRHF